MTMRFILIHEHDHTYLNQRRESACVRRVEIKHVFEGSENLSYSKKMLLFEQMIIPVCCAMIGCTSSKRVKYCSLNNVYSTRHLKSSMCSAGVQLCCWIRKQPRLKLDTHSLTSCMNRHSICNYAIFKDTKSYRYPLILSLTTCVLCL